MSYLGQTMTSRGRESKLGYDLPVRRIALTSVFIIASVILIMGSNNPASQQLLVEAERHASLFGDQQGPFQLEVDFSAQLKVPTSGHLSLRWAATDRWWRKVVLGEFQQIDIRHGEMLYTTRNVDFTPIRVRELIALLQFAEGNNLVATKQKQMVRESIAVTCLRVQNKEEKSEPHEVCLNSATHDILSDAWNALPDEQRLERYADYLQLGTHYYPRKLELLVNGSKVISAAVSSLTDVPFDDNLLVVPKEAIARRQCPHMKHPIALKTPDPAYPASASRDHLIGDTTVSMTVLADGTVADIRLLGSATHSMDDATLQALKKWRFKPAMCGAEPVVSDIEVVVSFRLE